MIGEDPIYPEDKRPPLDDKAVNDPEAWGFCRLCAFEVAVVDGLRVEHRRHRIQDSKTICAGSGKPPDGPTPVEAWQQKQPSLVKNFMRHRARSNAQRQRWINRERARRLREQSYFPSPLEEDDDDGYDYN